jgi:hypothetical protein
MLVGQSHAAMPQLLPKRAILFDKVLDPRLLSALNPAPASVQTINCNKRAFTPRTVARGETGVTPAQARSRGRLLAPYGKVFPTLPLSLLGIAQESPRVDSLSRSSQKQATWSGVDGTRTRGLRRDRPAL